jgi:hypothetical protein
LPNGEWNWLSAWSGGAKASADGQVENRRVAHAEPDHLNKEFIEYRQIDATR